MDDSAFYREITTKTLGAVAVFGEPISEFTVEAASKSGQYRLYVKRGESSFLAAAIECREWDVGGVPFGSADDIVEELFLVTAYFDGVRHLEFNRGAGDMAGYMYYPDMEGLILLLQKVREVELECCPSAE